MNKRKPQKAYWEMNAEELAEATKEFDRPIPNSKTRPLTRQERAQFEKWRKGPHFSVFVTRDADGVFLRLPPDVLRQSLQYANEHGMTLSQVVSRGLKGLL